MGIKYLVFSKEDIMKYFNDENRSSRILSILEQKHSVSLETLTEKLNVSSKTIKNEIKKLNDQLDNSAFVDIKHGVYKIYIFDRFKFERVKQEIYSQRDFLNSPQRRMAFIVYKLINSEKSYLIDDLAYEMNVARTTIINDMKKIKEILSDYNLSIIGRPNNGIILEGNELDIRNFILENIYEITYEDFKIDEDIVQFVKDTISKYKLDKETFEAFIKSLTVSFDRLMNGHSIKTLSNKYGELLRSWEFEVVTSIVEEIERRLQINFILEERLFLTLPIVGMRTPINIEEISQRVHITDEILKLVSDIIERIRFKMGLNITKDDILEDFVYHIAFLVNRLKYGVHLNNPLIDDIKENYKVAYKMAELAKEVIEENLKVSMTQDEVGFIAAYFGLFISEQELVKPKDYKIAVICGTGRVTAKLVESQLRNIFDSKTTIDLFSDDKVIGEVLDTYDLVLSTVKTKYNTSTKVLYLDKIFDKESLKRKIKDLLYAEKLDMPLVQGMDSLLLSILKEERFFILDSQLSYQENIDLMVENLYAKGYVDEGFKERIREREKKSTMAINEFVALPHTINYKSRQILISLGVSKDGVKINAHERIKLIFLICLPEQTNDDAVLVKVYDEIITIANNEKAVEDISTIENFKDLILYFVKENDIFD
ncbi:BglG family transcription antiterminator [Caproiciproducens sp. MSJ-32]|uniref:BglG family transcription antiterminator n=1 Tax=Caproiciproducens sp. MSJ-32 TaxID=2841527 RepID=UPI001C11764D|nr:BglG family transcription antiterminator [Caproiciproducens sp. MSJ-32]MBU5456053.1 BglG family transcription antiterminator [Caproiciproducens sp. MSJ-32]